MRKGGRRIIVASSVILDPSNGLDPVLPPNKHYLFMVELQRIKRAGSKTEAAAPVEAQNSQPLPEVEATPAAVTR